MEKDHFKDRTADCRRRSMIHPGDCVFICTKNRQRDAKDIQDLNLIKVLRNLTRQEDHPRGQKVQGTDVVTGQKLVGRVVYLTTDGSYIRTAHGDLTIQEWRNYHHKKK